MSQSLAKLLVHLVFSAKERGPLLTPAVARRIARRRGSVVPCQVA